MKKIIICPMFSTRYEKRYGVRIIFDYWFYTYMNMLNSLNKPGFFLNENPFLIKIPRSSGLRAKDTVNYSFFKKFSKLYNICIHHFPFSSLSYNLLKTITFEGRNEKRQNKRLLINHILTMKECHEKFRKEFDEKKYETVSRPIVKNFRCVFPDKSFRKFFYGHFYFHDMELMKNFLKNYFLIYDETFIRNASLFFRDKLRPERPFIEVCKIFLPVSEHYKRSKYSVSYHLDLDKIEKEIILKSDEKKIFSVKEVHEKHENICWERTDNKKMMKMMIKHFPSLEKGKLIYKSKHPITDKEIKYFLEQSRKFMEYFPELNVSVDMSLYVRQYDFEQI